MPYKLFRQGKKTCVKNTETGESKGCSDSHEQAVAHMRALYANEKKQLDEALDKALSEEPEEEPQEDKAQHEDVPALASFKRRIAAALEVLKEAVGLRQETEESEMLIWKEADGSMRWFGRYSNNFRDDDRPREIITADSHRQFVERVDKGLAPLPELWLWHVKEWKFGQATWVAYDETGFALAYGTIDKGKEALAEWLTKQKGVRMSHGMPTVTVKRDPVDPTIIVEHETREITVLPYFAAANKLTGWITLDNELDKEVDDMAVPQNKLEALVAQWGADPELLKAVEALNAKDAQKAVEEGRDYKEADTTVAATPDTPPAEGASVVLATASDANATEVAQVKEEAEAVPSEAAPETPEAKEAPAETPAPYPTREEVAEAFVPIHQTVKELAEKLDAVLSELAALKASDAKPTVKEETPPENVPAASLAALIAQRVTKSAVGSAEAQVKKGSALARSKPKETESEADRGATGIPFLDAILSTRPHTEE